jgi:GNAT superfamily N-acetyltransferase
MATLEETLRKLGLSAARGVPQLATGFVDLAALPFTMTGVMKPEQAVGSTAYLTSKGLLPPPQEGLLSETTELVSSAMNPAAAAKTVGLIGATKAGKGILDAVAKLPTIEVSFIPESKFLFAKNENGLVGGHIKDNILRITTAEVDEASRGKGIGTALYKKLIDDALSKGLKVTSDFTVEAPAVKVYDSLKKQGYDVKRLDGGSLEDGTAFGKNAANPAFEIISAPKQKK